MQFYSTNNRALRVDLQQAVMQGLATDKGLFMPVSIPVLPDRFFSTLTNRSFRDVAFEVTRNLLGADLSTDTIRSLIEHTIQFDAPLVPVGPDIFAQELFHGPTMAFKDYGARFLAGLLAHYADTGGKEITILVATSGDTGSAVANGFLNVAGTKVIVLYPKGKVSDIQEKQFTTLGGNITAVEVDGTFDDCQRLVKTAFQDAEISRRRTLTSANSINIARLIPQTFYYFRAVSQLEQHSRPLVISVPSGNFGNLTAGILAKRMGLPVFKLIAATNINDIVPEYLRTSAYAPRPSLQTISNAMDVGDPSNFARMLDLYDNDAGRLRLDIDGYAFNDEETRDAMRTIQQKERYIMDPHGAVGYLGLKKYMATHSGVQGIFLETAHPGKFKNVVENTMGMPLRLPDKLAQFMKKEKSSMPMSSNFEDLKGFLMTSA